MDKDIEKIIIQKYSNGKGINPLSLEYNIDYKTIKNILKRNNIQDNLSGRFCQPYEYDNEKDCIKIRIRKGNNFVYCLIDKEDEERCKNVGIWSLTKDGYVINSKSKTYLHRFIMNPKENQEVDHIYHNLLDNRKSQLRIATSKQQKFNTKKRKNNTSGHRGIYYDKQRNKWCINIKNGNIRFMKRYNDYDEAVKICDKKLNEWHKDFKYKEGE